MRKVLSCLAVAVVLACPGCGKSIYPVSGKVTHNGFPAADATVFFVRRGADSDEPAIMSIVQNDGTFELVCSEGKGAPPGNYDVFIEWTRVSGQGRRRQGPDVFRGRYADRKSPLLHATVKAEVNNLAPFDLAD